MSVGPNIPPHYISITFAPLHFKCDYICYNLSGFALQVPVQYDCAKCAKYRACEHVVDGDNEDMYIKFHFRTNFNEIWIKILTCSIQKAPENGVCKMTSLSFHTTWTRFTKMD